MSKATIILEDVGNEVDIKVAFDPALQDTSAAHQTTLMLLEALKELNSRYESGEDE